MSIDICTLEIYISYVRMKNLLRFDNFYQKIQCVWNILSFVYTGGGSEGGGSKGEGEREGGSEILSQIQCVFRFPSQNPMHPKFD